MLRGVKNLSLVAEEKGLLQNSGINRDSTEYNFQRAVTIKGVDENYKEVSGVPGSVVRGNFVPVMTKFLIWYWVLG